MIILNNSMDNHTIVDLLNSAIQDLSSCSEIVPKNVKAKRIFWNNELSRWYGVDSQIYRSGDKIKTSEDYIIVGNLPKRCYNKTRGSCSLRPEFYENLDSPRKNKISGPMDDSLYSRVMFPSERSSERENPREIIERSSEKEEISDEEMEEEREKRREKSREMMEKMMSERGDDIDYEDDD